MKFLPFIAFLAAGSAQALPAMSGKEFEALSQGTTMYFTEEGEFFGAEQFFSDRRTVWRAQDGTCVNGKWTENDEDICFFYDNGDGPHCWRVVQSELGISVISTSNADGLPPTILDLSRQDTTPILCTGPLFGVRY